MNGKRPSQRARRRSALRIAALVLLGVGTIGVVISILAPYTPSTANPVLINYRPVLDLSIVGGFGIMTILFGALAYFFALKFER